MSFEWISDPAIWGSLATLTVLEIVLGIDNIVFISVIVGRLPAEQSKRARQIGLALALVFRVMFLLLLTWLIGLTETLFSTFGHDFSWRDLILLAPQVTREASRKGPDRPHQPLHLRVELAPRRCAPDGRLSHDAARVAHDATPGHARLEPAGVCEHRRAAYTSIRTYAMRSGDRSQKGERGCEGQAAPAGSLSCLPPFHSSSACHQKARQLHEAFVRNTRRSPSAEAERVKGSAGRLRSKMDE